VSHNRLVTCCGLVNLVAGGDLRATSSQPVTSTLYVLRVMSLYISPNSRKHQTLTVLMEASYNNSGPCRFWDGIGLYIVWRSVSCWSATYFIKILLLFEKANKTYILGILIAGWSPPMAE